MDNTNHEDTQDAEIKRLHSKVDKLRSSVVLLISFMVEQMGIENEFMATFQSGGRNSMSALMMDSLAKANETVDPIEPAEYDNVLTSVALTPEDIQGVLEGLVGIQSEQESTSVPSFSTAKESSPAYSALIQLTWRVQDVLVLYGDRISDFIKERLSEELDNAISQLGIAMIGGELSKSDAAYVRFAQSRQDKGDTTDDESSLLSDIDAVGYENPDGPNAG